MSATIINGKLKPGREMSRASMESARDLKDLIKIEKTLSLKEKLDEIDREIYEEVFNGFYESRVKILLAMWEKGKVIVGSFTLLKAPISFRQLEQETGRERHHLKRWHDLYKKYSHREEYLKIAEKKAEEWTNKVLAGKESSNNLALLHTANEENYTPEEIIKSVKDVFDGEIDLDPASCEFAQNIIQAKEYFTIDDDGLSKPWRGNVFLNPPYQMPEIREFTNKLIKELSNIQSAILLTNNNTDTLWFHKCAEYAKLICFTKGRINFYTKEIEETQPRDGQAFFYFGNDEEKFREIFSEIGLIMRKISGRLSGLNSGCPDHSEPAILSGRRHERFTPSS